MDRKILRFVVVGHTDHGKSTLVGRLLYDTGSLSKQKMAELRQVCDELGSDLEFAFLLDQFEEERLGRITIDTTQVCFRTELRDYVIIDAPGHKQFLKNMITGTCQADAAVVLVDITQGLREQTRRHIHLLKILGINQVILLINKMDLIGFDREPFETLLIDILSCLRQFDLRPLAVVPISAHKGDNVARKSVRMPWYSRPTFLAALDRLTLPVLEENRPLRLPIQDIYRIDGHNVSVGRIVSGSICVGQDIVILPSGRSARIASIQNSCTQRSKAVAGESIGIIFDNGVVSQRGQVVCAAGSQPSIGNELVANIFWMDPQPLKLGERLTLKLATQEVPCRVRIIANRTDSASLEVLEAQANELADTELAQVILTTQRTMCSDSFPFIKEMGRLVLVRRGDTVAGGIIP